MYFNISKMETKKLKIYLIKVSNLLYVENIMKKYFQIFKKTK